MNRNRVTATDIFLSVIICLIWGTTWFAIKKGLEAGVPSFQGAGIRFLISSVFLFMIILYRKAKFPTSFSEYKPALFLGVFYFFIPYSLIYWSENHIPSALAGVIYGTLPLLVTIFSHFMLQTEPISLLKIISALVGISGLVLIFSSGLKGQGELHSWGVIAMITASLVTAYSTVYMKRHSNRLDIFVYLWIQVTVGGLLLIILGLIAEGSFNFSYSSGGWLSIVYLSLLGTVLAWSLWVYLIGRLPVVLVSYNQFFIPIVALTVGLAWGKEEFQPVTIAGVSLIFVSILLVIRAVKTNTGSNQ